MQIPAVVRPLISNGWVVVVTHATTEPTNVTTSSSYTDVGGKVVTGQRASPRPAIGVRKAALTSAYARLEFDAPVPVSFSTEDSPRGLWRSLGKRVGFTPSRVRISYPPPG